jgi:uncharacterized heparinase superfamily protein
MARRASSSRPVEPPLPVVEQSSDGVLLRVGPEARPSIGDRLATRISVSLYNTPLHQLRLRGRYPLKLLGVPVDPVPGDPVIGERVVAGRLIHAGHTAMIRDLAFAAPAHPAAWRDWANGWGWLRDIQAWLPDRKAAAAVAEPLVSRWLDQHAEFDAVGWRADVTGTRLLMALGHAPIILSSADQVYRSALLSAMATWARHLDRAAFRLDDGPAKAVALAGLYAAGVLIPGGEARTIAALAALEKLLGTLVLPDGGVATRAPVDALMLAELLLFAGNCAPAVAVRAPPLFADTLARLVPNLRGLALGDRRIGAWHGGAAIAFEPLERLAKRAATGTALVRGGRWSGYHRLSSGKTVLVVDAGPPPLAQVSRGGHAGTLAFELSDGPDRLITNCGGVRGLPTALAPELADGLRTTAAHSTLVIAETNSTAIKDGGALGKGVEEVTIQARSSEQGQWLEASHDGYARRFGMLVRRQLFLSPDGFDLRGADTIEALPAKLLRRRPDRDFAVRFHLGPGVAATPTADGAGALMKLPQGRVWAMKVRGGQVTIEPSLWVDPAGVIHKTQQLVINGRTAKAAASIGWSFKRAGK